MLLENNLIMNNLKFTKSLLIFVLALISSSPSIAGVRSVSAGIDVLENGVIIGNKVMVACTNGFIKRAIVKRETEEQWCDDILGSVCAVTKKAAARLVCDDEYRIKIADKDDFEADTEIDQGSNKDSDEIVKLKQELMDIELKRLDIADKVLELKRKELQLQKDA